MRAMIRAAIRGFLAFLLVCFYVPAPGAFEPVAAGESATRAACCAPKACCTPRHACSGGGACATDSRRTGHDQKESRAPATLLTAGSCHPEAARVGTTPTLDPGLLAVGAPPVQGGILGRPGALALAALSTRTTSPQVPPPRA